MDQFAELSNNIYDSGIVKEGLTSPSSLFLSLIVTMIPKIVPRMMPRVMTKMYPGVSVSRFDDVNYIHHVEDMFREKFAQNLMIVVDILDEEKYGLKKERYGREGQLARIINTSLHALNIDVRQFDSQRLTELAELVNGHSPRAEMYNLIGDMILAVFQTIGSIFVGNNY
eukprot:TRINITY_DN36902_c0_g1_i1.p1 TRINITY_DN36902_c0_g1~~TRINITY_DN36902_c0_g1_i1.p1  ORF type:complete len:180 (-),score=39.65 TRINITY_DN36902_c0_g1_i1:311-820(-)